MGIVFHRSTDTLDSSMTGTMDQSIRLDCGMATSTSVKKWSCDPSAVPDDSQAGGRCIMCGGEDMRFKFPLSNDPITYCIDCMLGRSARGIAVDMHVFESCEIQHLRKLGKL